MTSHDTRRPAGADDGPQGDAHHIEDLTATPAPATGVHSRTLHTGGGVSLVHFGFAAGEELSEHTSSRTAVIHILSGEFDMVVGDERIAGRAGTWVRMPPGTAHSLRASVPATMLLTLLPRDG